jgi:hypothetical protein
MADASGKREGLLVREVDGEVLVLDSVADRIHQMNATASLIWQLAVRGMDPVEIAKVLENQFEVNNDIALTDVRETLAEFRKLQLLQ